MKAFLLVRQPYMGLLNRAINMMANSEESHFWLTAIRYWSGSRASTLSGSHAAVQHHPWIAVCDEFRLADLAFREIPHQIVRTCTHKCSFGQRSWPGKSASKGGSPAYAGRAHPHKPVASPGIAHRRSLVSGLESRGSLSIRCIETMP